MKDLVGPYRIQSLLGHGGMGIVYLGVHDHLGREVAIKALAPELTRHPQFRERFFAEARVQAKLQHTNIVTIYDLIEDEGSFFIVMEHVPGPTLEALLKEGDGNGWDVVPALTLFRQILAGLDYAHSKGVIHRDVKPSNVLVAEGDQAKLTDFGIALLIGDKRLTASQSTIGTPIYMSPEQILRPLWVDHRSDVYSAAVVLYEMLAGRPPFDAATEYEIKKLQIEAPVPDLRAIHPRVPAAVAEAISTALRKDPDDRFQSAGAFLRALRNDPIIAPVPTLAAPVAAVQYSKEEPPPERPAARLPRPVIAAAAAAILLVGLAFLAFLWRGRAADSPTISTDAAPPPAVSEPAEPLQTSPTETVPVASSEPVETVAPRPTPLASPPPVAEPVAPKSDPPSPPRRLEASLAGAVQAKEQVQEKTERAGAEQTRAERSGAEPDRVVETDATARNPQPIEPSRELQPANRAARKLNITKVEIRSQVVARGTRVLAFAHATVEPPFQQPTMVNVQARVMRNMNEIIPPLRQPVKVPAGERTWKVTIPIRFPMQVQAGDCYLDVEMWDAAQELRDNGRIGFTIQ